jgi:hypothetical protein
MAAGAPRVLLSRRSLLALGPAAVLTPRIAMAENDRAASLSFFVHPTNPVEHVDLEHLRSLYLGDREYWPNDRRIALVVWQADTPQQSQFLADVMRMSAREWRNHWVQRRYSGRAVNLPFVVASHEAAARYVERTEGAIAFSTDEALPGRVVYRSPKR